MALRAALRDNVWNSMAVASRCCVTLRHPHYVGCRAAEMMSVLYLPFSRMINVGQVGSFRYCRMRNINTFFGGPFCVN